MSSITGATYRTYRYLKQRRADSHARRASLSTLLRWALAECGKPPRVLVPFFAARNNVAVSGWTTFRVPVPIPRTPGADSDKRGWRARPFSCARASAPAGPRAGAASRPGHDRAHACATVQVTATLTRVRRCLAVSICISRGQRIWSIA